MNVPYLYGNSNLTSELKGNNINKKKIVNINIHDTFQAGRLFLFNTEFWWFIKSGRRQHTTHTYMYPCVYLLQKMGDMYSSISISRKYSP